MNEQYEALQTKNIGKSGFDLTHIKQFDCNIGALVPVLVEEVLPGDVFQLANQSVIRSQTLVVPIYHKLEAKVYYFYQPNRQIWEKWEKFITGGVDGLNADTLPKIFDNVITTENHCKIDRYNLWDYFGLPMHNPSTGVPVNTKDFSSQPPVIDLPWRMYWSIWREFYRDENIQTTYPNSTVEVGQGQEEQIANLETFMDEYQAGTYEPLCDQIAYGDWEKDYFTSAFPTQQRGISPVIPISGTTSAVWGNQVGISGNQEPVYVQGAYEQDSFMATTGNYARDSLTASLNNNTVSFTATGVDITDLRLAIQTQRYLELSMRGGYRYDEYVNVNFGVSKKDFRTIQPQYIGGTKSPVVISEVLQTGETGTTPLGTMGGHGLSAGTGFAGKFRVPEHGYIMAIMVIQPESIYQQGIPRQWSKESRYDYYAPSFKNLSEQEIKKQELFYTEDGTTTDETLFGYQGAWDEYRNRRSSVSGKMASDLNYWNLSRVFDSAPSLNDEFLSMKNLSQNRRDAWAVSGVESGNLGQFVVQFKNDVKAIRPLPYMAIPSLM